MTALNDHEISSLIATGKLIKEGYYEGSVTPNGYDLRVETIRVNGKDSDRADITPNSHFLVSTLEYLDLPDNIVGQIWIRSSFARRGIIGSFGAVDAGFSGNLTLSFLNAGSENLSLAMGERIAQIVFHRLESQSERSYAERSGNYQNSRGVTVKR